MESIFEEWNDGSTAGGVSSNLNNNDPMGFGIGDSGDGSGFGLNQVRSGILRIIHRVLLTTQGEIRTRCFLLSVSLFL